MENFFSHPKLSEIQDDLKSILDICYTHLENEYKQNALSFLSNTSTVDLIKFVGVFIEKQNAYSKLKSNFKEDWYEIDLPHHQTDRQQVYLSNLECINILFTNLFSSEHYQTRFSEKTALFDTQNEQKLINLIELLHQKKALDNFIDFVVYDKWDYRIENQNLKIEPKDDISKTNYLRSCSAPSKLKAELNYTDKFIDTLLFSLGIDIEILQNQRTQFSETF